MTDITKARILDASERLFAEKGYDATSLREITAAAQVNLAAVNYHFRCKLLQTLKKHLFYLGDVLLSNHCLTSFAYCRNFRASCAFNAFVW